MAVPQIDAQRLGARLRELGEIGSGSQGGRTRLAPTNESRQARDLIVSWMKEAGAVVRVHEIGNLFGILPGELRGPSIMTGSHIDTVAGAGALDGCYGVVAGIEVLHALRECYRCARRDVVVAVFTSEQSVIVHEENVVITESGAQLLTKRAPRGMPVITS